MATIFGALGLQDTDRVFNATIGQRAIYDLSTQYVAKFNQDFMQAARVFVENSGSEYKLRYKLPGSGKLQRRQRQSLPGAVKASGQWDVAFPLEDFGATIAADDVSMAYMTAAELQRHIDTVVNQAANTRRYEILRALFNNASRTFNDELWGNLVVQPLANGDSVTFPPVIGSEADATENHYLESGYLASAISDTNNPLVTGAAELEEHFGTPSGGSNIVAFVNNAQTAKIQALTDFVPITATGVIPGTQTATITAVPPELTMGSWRVLGRDEAAGVWVVEWRYMPANYLTFVHLDAPKPLMERVDPADTGLGTGLQLVAKDLDIPFETSFWRDRFGYGVGNRLNGVVMELGTGGTYDVPAGY